MTDYHILTLSHMCAEGQDIRARAILAAVRIRPQAWEDATPSQRTEMLDCARSMSYDYTTAFEAWRAHRAGCAQCREATQT